MEIIICKHCEAMNHKFAEICFKCKEKLEGETIVTEYVAPTFKL